MVPEHAGPAEVFEPQACGRTRRAALEPYDDFEFLDVERRDTILIATLNRPATLNSIRESDHHELARLLRIVADDDATNVIVLRGAGRAFSAGGDYTLAAEMTGNPAALVRNQRMVRDLVQAQVDLEKPVIAAVHGQTSGAGAALALLSDFIIADRTTRIADGHVRYAMAAGDGGVLFWPMAMGLVRAKRYLLTGDYIDPDEALRLGLITEVVDAGLSFSRAMEWAEQLAGLNPAAVRLTKRALNSWLAQGMCTAFNVSLGFEMLTLAQPEARENVDRLLSKTRQPQ